MHTLLAMAPRAHRCSALMPLRIWALGGVLKLSWFRSEHALCLKRLPMVLPSLVRVHEGQARLITDGQGEILGPGTMQAWSAGRELDVEVRPDSRSGCFSAVALSFELGWLRDRPAPAGAAHCASMFRPPAALDVAWAQLLEAWQGGAEVAHILNRVETLLSILRSERLGQGLWSGGSEQAWSDRVRTELLSMPGRRWEAGDVAEQLRVSEATLRRHLMQENTCFRSLLEEVRLAKSLELLLDHPNAVAAVAARCGYESCSRFSARFQRRFGLKPSELRSGAGRRA